MRYLAYTRGSVLKTGMVREGVESVIQTTVFSLQGVECGIPWVLYRIQVVELGISALGSRIRNVSVGFEAGNPQYKEWNPMTAMQMFLDYET